MSRTHEHHWNRRGFAGLITALVGGLRIPCGITAQGQSDEDIPTRKMILDESYLVKGLTGMARAKGWFDAHWGAGILAGFYLCHDNPTSIELTAAIKRQLDIIIQKRAEQFVPFASEQSDEALIDDIPNALRPAVEGGLRAHGHAVIFASLATRALRDVPRLAQPALIKRLCGLSHQIAGVQPQAPADPAFVYPDSNTMVEATLDSLLRFRDLLGRPSVRRPNFTHMVTHTEALLSLELMGYPDIARMGHAGQQTHISVSVPDFDVLADVDREAVTLEKLRSPEFWNDETNQDRWRRKWSLSDNPNGDWIAAGHLFKVLHSYHRLIACVPEKQDLDLCTEILLERYVNPQVQGG